MAEVDSLEIKISATSEDAAKKVNDLVNALEKLKKAGGKDFSETAKKIEVIAKASASIKDAGDNVRKLAEGLKSFSGLGKIKIPEKLAEKLEILGKSAQSLSGASDNVSNVAEAMQKLGAVGKINISKTVPERLHEIGAAMEDISQDAIARLDSVTNSLQRLSGVDLKGLPGAMKAAKQSSDPARIASEIEKTDSRLEKTKQLVANLEKEYAALQKRQGKGSTKTQVETNVALAETSQKLQEQKSLYDQLLQKREELSQLATGGKNARSAGETGPELQPGKVDGTIEKVNILAQLFDKIKNNPFSASISKQFTDATSSAKSFEKAFSSTDTIFDNLKNAASDAFSQIMAAHPKLAAVALAIKAVYNTVQKFFDEIRKNFSKLVSWLQSVGRQIGAVAKQAASSFGNQLKSVGASILSRFTKPFTNALDVFQKWKSAIGRVAFYRMVRSAIKAVTDGFKTGIENLYQYSRLVNTEFAPAMNQLATSALYLKNSLGAMAAPLIQALAPAIDFIIDKFVALFNIVGKVMAALTGKSTYTQAKKHAVEYTEAAEGASKATEEFQRYLIGIDELNIINDNKDNGGGGGGLDDYADMFEETPLPDWAEDIKEKIDDDDWTGAGESLADHLNDLLDQWDPVAWGKKLGEMINRALEFAYGFLTHFDFEKFGVKIAQGLNSLFATINWDLLGRTFAAGWNALIDVAYGFVTTFEWKKFGTYIATAINGFIDEIHLEKAGQTLGIALRGILTTAITILTETDWSALAVKFGDAVNAFLTEYSKGQSEGYDFGILFAEAFNKGVMALDSFLDSGAIAHLSDVLKQDLADFVSTIQLEDAAGTLAKLLDQLVNGAINLFGDDITWATLGQKIGASLREFFMGENDWISDIGTLVGTVIYDAVTAIENFADQFTVDDWIELGNRVAESINNFFQEMTPEDWGNLGEALHSLGEGLLMAAQTAIEKIDWGKINESLEQFLDKLDITDLQSKFHELFRQVYDAAAPIIQTIFSELGGFVWTGFVQGIGDWFAKKWSDAKAFFGDFVDNVKRYLGINSPSTVFEEIGDYTVEGFYNGITGSWGDVVDLFKEKFDAIKEQASDTWENIKTTASQKWNNIKTTVGTVWDNMKSGAKTAFENIKNSVSTTTENTKSKLTSAWNNLKSTLSTTWNTLKSNASSTFSSMQSTISSTHETMKSKISSAWQSIKSTITGVLSSIGSAVSTTFNNVVNSAVQWGNDMAGKIATGINNGVSKVTSAAKNLAGKVADYVHFSEPDVGPLANFHEFMPDMLALMAKGIRDNAYLAVNAVGDVAGQLSGAFSNMVYDAPKPRFSNLEDMQVNYKLAYAGGYDQQQSGGTYAEAAGGTNADVVSALFAVATQIVTAINNKEFEANLDGEKIAKRVTTIQEQRNRMYRR